MHTWQEVKDVVREASFITKVNGIGVQPKTTKKQSWDMRAISNNLSYVLIYKIYIFQSFCTFFQLIWVEEYENNNGQGRQGETNKKSTFLRYMLLIA